VIFQHDPKLLILASRSLKAIDETIIAIGGQKSSENVRAVQLDLSDLESVRRAAAEILEITPTVDVLINNAGIMSEFSALWD
jgi:NAD(P)-dependent dehydrogenase (short-subunit alcohol dehydrogenase family)